MFTPATVLARAAATTSGAAAPITLNSIFSPAASCGDLYLQTGWLSLGGPEASSISSCFPSGWATGTTQYFTGTAAMCPQGYEVVGTTPFNIGTVTATTGTCCPSDWLPYTGTGFFDGERCTSKIYSASNLTVTTKAAGGIGYTTTVLSVVSGDGLNAYGVAMQWQTADSTSSSSTATATSGSGLTSSAATSTSTASSTGSSKSSSGLSSGAKAGVGVGVAIGALLILGALLAFFFRRRRAHRAAVAAAGPGYGGYVEGTSELGGNENKSPGQHSVNTAYGGPPAAYGQQNGHYTPVPQGSPNSGYAAQQQQYGNGWNGTGQQPQQQHELPGGHEMHELDGGQAPHTTGGYA